MVFDVNILGSGSATPRLYRGMTAQYLNILERHILVDCAEGTQLQFQKFRLKPSRVDYIFISHLHGDHYLGLVGLISSMQLFGRTKPLKLFGPEPLLEIIELNLKATESKLTFDLDFTALTSDVSELIFEDNVLEVHTIPLKHRVYCNGFLFKEKIKPRRINGPLCEKLNVPVAMMHRLKKGEDWIKEDGSVIKNSDLTFDPHPSRSYAFCSDTKYNPDMVPIIKEADLLYHEATFLRDLKDRAKKTMHSTAEQAALIAAEAKVKKLIMGHFSVRYDDLKLFENEAREVFSESYVVKDGEKYSL